ncbi:MAG: AbrB/MazE/SpoVT family DNA-binding domain-containing protein [Nitrospirae bacterium]|nr:AbrB/MazE/SpoVT family DNA-binding domain-containing protein [Nitrospirota bacterium]
MKAITMSAKGQIAIPKEVRDTLNIKEGDQFIIEIAEGGRIILEPAVNIPRSQAWFWAPEVQDKIKEAEKNYKKGKFKRYEDADNLIKDLEKRG